MSFLTKSFFVVIGTAFFSGFLTYLFIRIAQARKWYDKDVHQFKQNRKVPTGGGLTIFISFWLVLTIVTPSWIYSTQYLGTFLASLLIVITGMIDDKFELRPWQKAIGIFIAANIIYFVSDVTFSTTLLPNVTPTVFNIMTYVFTIGWIFLVTNAINLLDGIDGLASSVTLISLLTLIVITYFFSLSIPLMLITMLIILFGAILGFIPFNWFRAKIYLGDTGALFIGFMFGVLSVGNLKNASFYSLIVPVLIYLVPLFDTLYAIIRRLTSGTSIAKPDNNHIHHRLLRLGLKEWQVVLVMVGVTTLFSVMAILTQLFQEWRQMILLIAIIITAVMLVSLRWLSKNEK